MRDAFRNVTTISVFLINRIGLITLPNRYLSFVCRTRKHGRFFSSYLTVLSIDGTRAVVIFIRRGRTPQ